MAEHEIVIRHAKRITTDRADLVKWKAWSYTARVELEWSTFFSGDRDIRHVLKKLGIRCGKGHEVTSRRQITDEFLQQDRIIGRKFCIKDYPKSSKVPDFIEEIPGHLHQVTEQNNEVLEWALLYAHIGFAVLPLYSIRGNECTCWKKDKCDTGKGKHPIAELVPSGVTDATKDANIIRRWWNLYPEANVGIATGGDSRLLVLDIDGDAGEEALFEITKQYGPLPDTARQITGGAGLHYVFRYPSSHSIKNSASQIGDHIDVRGEGGYIVAHPSIHRTGNRYIWEVECDPQTMPPAPPPEWLIKLCKGKQRIGDNTAKKDGSKLPSERIAEGKRNDTLYRQACYLRKYGWDASELLVAIDALNRNRCDPPMHATEIQKIIDSAMLYDPDRSINDKDRHYNHVIDDPFQAIDMVNKEYAIASVGAKTIILRERYDYQMERPVVDYMNTTDFNLKWSGKKVVYIDSDGKEQQTKLSQFWIESDLKRSYEQVVFDPGNEDDRNYNLWRGFTVEPKEGDITPFLNHIKRVICGDDEDNYNYVLTWMADAVQNPKKKPGTAIVLRGKQGTGKGIFCQAFGQLFGRHYVYISSNDHLTGNFNSHMKDTLIVFADEAFWAGDKSKESVLKSMITESSMIIEQKGIDAVQAPNFIRLMMASNYDWVVPGSAGDERRYVCLDVSDERMQDSEYFASLCKNIYSKDGQAALLHFLQNWDCSKVNLRQIPKSEPLLEQKLIGLDTAGQFIFTLLLNGEIPDQEDDWPEKVNKDTLYKQYVHYCKDMGRRGNQIYEPQYFTKKLRQIFPQMSIRQARSGCHRYRVYEFPPLEECKESFERYMGQAVPWDKYGGTDDQIPF